ncbi:uncharacterized protein HaLaN_09503, partial [Haematococcus lacustris]
RSGPRISLYPALDYPASCAAQDWTCSTALFSPRALYVYRWPHPKPSYEDADSPEVLAQLFGRNDTAFKPAPVPADTLFPIQPGHQHRPHWATVLTSTMLSISDSYALPTTTSIVWCHYQPDSPSSLPSLFRNFRHNRRTNVFFIPKTMPVNTNSVYYAALTVPSAMGCPELPLVVVEDDVAFAPNFYNHLSNLHKSALDLAGSEPFLLTLYRPSRVNNTVNVMKRLRDIQNRSGLLEDSWQTPHKETPLASLSPPCAPLSAAHAPAQLSNQTIKSPGKSSLYIGEICWLWMGEVLNCPTVLLDKH